MPSSFSPASGFATILIAHRGKMAGRVVRTARTVAMFSDADAQMPNGPLAARARNAGRSVATPDEARAHLGLVSA